MDKTSSNALGKILSLVLVLAMVVGFFPSSILPPINAKAAPETLITISDDNPAVITQDGTYRIKGTGHFTVDSAHGIWVKSGVKATVILDNVTITTKASSANIGGFEEMPAPAAMMVGDYGNTTAGNSVVDTEVLLLLEGKNVLQSGYVKGLGIDPGNVTNDGSGGSSMDTCAAGLEIWRGAKVTIDSIVEGDDSSGSLVARSSNNYGEYEKPSAGNGGGAGIITGNRRGSGGNLVIRGGTITAIAGAHGAGIGDSWGRTIFWQGTFIAYGGQITCRGGGHGAGIGGACYSGDVNQAGRGSVLVLPPADITTTSEGATRSPLGGVTNQVYIGDPLQPYFWVRLDDGTGDPTNPTNPTPIKGPANQDVYLDLKGNDVIKQLIDQLVPVDYVNPSNNLDPENIWMGKTDSNGMLQSTGVFPDAITFKTEAKSANNQSYTTVDSEMLPAKDTVGDDWYWVAGTTQENAGKRRTITLEAPEAGLKNIVADGADLFFGYSPDPTKDATVTVTNDSNRDLNNVYLMFGDTNMAFDVTGPLVVTGPSGPGVLKKGESVVINLPLKAGLAARDLPYELWVQVSADDLTTDQQPDAISVKQKVSDRAVTAQITSDYTTVGSVPFEAGVEFNEAVTGLTEGAFTVVNGSVVAGSLLGDASTEGPTGYFTKWEYKLEAVSGLVENAIIMVNLPAGSATDDHNQGNAGSNIKAFVYSNTKPTGRFNFVNDEVFNEHKTDVKFTIDGNGIGTAINEVKIGGAALTGSNVSGAITVSKTEAGSTTTISPTYTINANNEIAFNHTFDEGAYEVTVADGQFHNNIAATNTMDQVIGKFEVRVPTVEDKTGPDGKPDGSIDPNKMAKIHVVPVEYEYTGGNGEVVIHGKNLQYVKPGQLQIGLPASLGGGTVDAVPSADGLSASYPVTFPLNELNTYVPYIFEGFLNNTSFGTATAIVKAASTIWPADGSGLAVNPSNVDFEGQDVAVTVSGENLHNVNDLRVKVRNDNPNTTGELGNIDANVTYSGNSVEGYTFTIPQNVENYDIVWMFELYDGNNMIATTGYRQNVTQTEATPQTDTFTVSETRGEAGDVTLTLDDVGGDVHFNIEGVNLHNFKPMSITNDSAPSTVIDTVDDANLIYVGATNEQAHTDVAVAIPENKTQADITYTFELMYNSGNASGQTVTVVVKKPELGVDSYEADIKKHLAPGGDTLFTLTGTHMDVAGVVLRDQYGTDYPISNFTNNGSNADVLVTFPPHDPSSLRNKLYDMEVIFNGQPTGRIITIEVGPSKPSITGSYAQPDYFANVTQLLANGGKSTIVIEGNYLENFDSIEIYDRIYQTYYSVVNVGCDTETRYVVTVPTAVGLFTYDIWADGQETGFQAQIGVGVVPLGGSNDDMSGGTDDGSGVSKDDTKKKPEFVGAGGGSKGDGFTGNAGNGFDVLNHQSKQAAKNDPKNPTVSLKNVGYISEEYLNLAASGAKLGAQQSEKSGSGPLKLILDTTKDTNDKVLEGRMYVTLNKPIQGLFPGVYTRDEKVKATRELFKSKFDNKNIWVVNLEQNRKFGTTIEIAALLEDISVKDNSLKLYIYRYDRETGEYMLLSDTNDFFDTAGYLHFETKLGGDIIVSDKPLTANGTSAQSGKLPIVHPTGTENALETLK